MTSARMDPGLDVHLLCEAVQLVAWTQHASVGLLQRRLRVGHGKACRLMLLMESWGVIAPPSGRGYSDALIPMEQADSAADEIREAS